MNGPAAIIAIVGDVQTELYDDAGHVWIIRKNVANVLPNFDETKSNTTIFANVSANQVWHFRARDTVRGVTGYLDLVTIQASVRDARGRTLQGLTAADFEVRDNGQLRPILSLGSDQSSPLSIAFLVDMSGSMRVGPKIDLARRAYESMLLQLRAADDEAAVFSFDSALHERQAAHHIANLRFDH